MVEEIVGSVIHSVRTGPTEVVGVVNRVDQDQILQIREDFENGCQPSASIEICGKNRNRRRIRGDGFDETMFETGCDDSIDFVP